jgi:hypothetical protein
MWPMGHTPLMRSRVHPKYKTEYRVSNWAEYDRALVQRGSITLWVSEDTIASWKPAPSGRRGGQRKFSDQVIETALTLRLVFNLPLRQAEGFLRSVLSLMVVDLEAPDHTTLSRRSQHLNIQLARVSTKQSIHLIVDSTGLSIVGEGEWAAAKYGGRGKRDYPREARVLQDWRLADTADEVSRSLISIDATTPLISAFRPTSRSVNPSRPTSTRDSD